MKGSWAGRATGGRVESREAGGEGVLGERREVLPWLEGNVAPVGHGVRPPWGLEKALPGGSTGALEKTPVAFANPMGLSP